MKKHFMSREPPEEELRCDTHRLINASIKQSRRIRIIYMKKHSMSREPPGGELRYDTHRLIHTSH